VVTPDGTIKALDFGLAAVTQPSRDAGEIATDMVQYVAGAWCDSH